MRQKGKVPKFRTIVWALTAQRSGNRCLRLEHRVNKAWAMRDQRLFTEGPTREHNEKQMGEEPNMIPHPFYYLYFFTLQLLAEAAKKLYYLQTRISQPT